MNMFRRGETGGGFFFIDLILFLFPVDMTKRRSLAGNAALVINAASIILVYVAFFSTSWIESDRRIPGTVSRDRSYRVSVDMCVLICFLLVRRTTGTFWIVDTLFSIVPPSQRCGWSDNFRRLPLDLRSLHQ